MDTPTLVILLALVAFALWAAYFHGRTLGACDGADVEAGRWRVLLKWHRRDRAKERNEAEAAISVQQAATDKLVAHCARQQRRLRGTLSEARRWKAVAVRLGWRRPSTKVPAVDDTVAMIAADDLQRGDTLAVGRDGRVWHWSTVVYGARSAPQPPPEPVEPTMVILPPQESAEAAERMAASVRKILGEVADEAAKAGGA